MERRRLGQDDFEDLSAYFDGCLDDDRAARVGRLVESDPLWAEAWRELHALDEALDTLTVPDAPADLAERVLVAVRRQRWSARLVRVARVAVPLAAAAAVIIVAIGLADWPAVQKDTHRRQPTPVAGNHGDDHLVVEKLDFLRDYDVVANYSTLEALERIEQASRDRETDAS